MKLDLKDIFIVAVSAFIGCLLGCILGCMLTVIIMKKVPTAQKIATVDIQGLIMRASSRLSLQDIPEADLKIYVNTLGDQLKGELQRLASQENLIILNSQGVIEGATDLTPLVETALNQDNYK